MLHEVQSEGRRDFQGVKGDLEVLTGRDAAVPGHTWSSPPEALQLVFSMSFTLNWDVEAAIASLAGSSQVLGSVQEAGNPAAVRLVWGEALQLVDTCNVHNVSFTQRFGTPGSLTDVQLQCSFAGGLMCGLVRAEVYFWPAGWVASG